MSGYRSGLTGLLLEYSIKKYRGHRAIPANIRNVLGEMAATPGTKMPKNVITILANENAARVV
jgi:hypothetical protein